MTRNDSRPSLWERFVNWETGDESVLDGEIEQSMDQAAPQEAGGEVYASAEKRADDHRTALVEEERSYYSRVHEWSLHKGVKLINRLYRLSAVLVLCFIIFFLMSTVVALPPFGDADNPYNNEVSQRYIEKGIEETGAINFVAGMILDYRAFDTFGESTVLFVAACSVLLLLKLGDHAPGEKPTPAMLEAEWDDRHHEPKNDAILQLAAKILVPVILLYGMYIVLNGHLSPGGGFSGGAVMGAGLILYLNAFGFQKTERFFTYRTFRWITFLALMTYAALKSYSFYTGANHIESGIPLGTPGAILSSGFILPLNICVGLIVMCTMYAFYTLFRKGGMTAMLTIIQEHLEEIVAVLLFAIGFTTLLLQRNLIKKIIGFNIMDTAIYLLLTSVGYIEGRTAPILTDGIISAQYYINPIPAGLVLTGIVVSVSVTALMLSLTVRLYRRYHTLDIDRITLMMKGEDD